jgi:hypothetical protein
MQRRALVATAVDGAMQPLALTQRKSLQRCPDRSEKASLLRVQRIILDVFFWAAIILCRKPMTEFAGHGRKQTPWKKADFDDDLREA